MGVKPAAPTAIRASDIPLDAIEDPVALAVILGADGPSYRPAGATMVIGRDGKVAGSLSSGCVDGDIITHAQRVADEGRSRHLRYGAGSPFLDITLPCGGGLDILVAPAGDPAALHSFRRLIRERRRGCAWIGDQGLSLHPCAGSMELLVTPDPNFLVFGKGPEAIVFARMVAGAGYATTLVSPDEDTLAACPEPSIACLTYTGAASLEHVSADAYTAAALFFHDHDHEPQILRHLLAGPAFYIGAQGSRLAAETRRERLRRLAISEDAISLIKGPIGLIPSTRDARTLAVSVLCEVLAEYGRKF